MPVPRQEAWAGPGSATASFSGAAAAAAGPRPCQASGTEGGGHARRGARGGRWRWREGARPSRAWVRGASPSGGNSSAEAWGACG